MGEDRIGFDNRVIVVTGAGRGMGRTHALTLAERGARMVIADSGVSMDGADPSAGPAKAVVDEIKAIGGEAVACTSDLSLEAGSTEAVEVALGNYGRIDGILHNASTVPHLVPTEKTSTQDLELVMRVNAFAGLWMARAAWPHMVRQNYGRIVLMTSTGIYGTEGSAPYCAAKAANIGVMRCLAVEGTKSGIFVNVIAPSARTRMTEGKLTSAFAEWLFKTMPSERVSVGAAYLMSEACQVTGEIFSMGGGRIGRIVICENMGALGEGASLEEVHEMLPRVLADKDFKFPRNNLERRSMIYAMLGWNG